MLLTRSSQVDSQMRHFREDTPTFNAPVECSIRYRRVGVIQGNLIDGRTRQP